MRASTLPKKRLNPLTKSTTTFGSNTRHWVALLLAAVISSVGLTIDVNAFDLLNGILPAEPKIEVYDIRQSRMGLADDDAIAVIVDTSKAEYSRSLEDETTKCVDDAFSDSSHSGVRIVAPEIFRRAAFPGLSAEQTFNLRWDERLNDTRPQESASSLVLRYLIAVTVSLGNSIGHCLPG